jgi:hypothetical protein
VSAYFDALLACSGLPVQQQIHQQQPVGGYGQPQEQYALQQPLQHQPALASGAYAHSVYT